MRRPIRMCLVLSLGVALAGCGQSSPPAAPPVVAPAPPPVAAPAPAAPAAAPMAAAAPASAGSKSGRSKIDPSVSEDRIYLVDAEQANFDIGDPTVGSDAEVAVITADPVSQVVVSGGTVAGRITAKLPDGFRALPEHGATSDGWPWRITCEADGAEMVYIPGSVFVQGTNEGTPEAAPAHGAFVDSFYIDLQEVTLERYFKCRNSLKDAGKQTVGEPLNAGELQNHPAVGVLWRDATAYAKWAKKELPTEAEWELAARGPNSYRYPWGNDRPIWEKARTLGQIDPVGSYRADVSPLGVFDMAGNAREWCADIFSADYYASAKERDGSAIRNPQGPRTNPNLLTRVAKGGKSDWELWHRAGESMQHRNEGIGFRCVLKLPAPAAAK